eukprot:CCRYP_012045-RB/>CCRYP_012045-RB protein AED:0.03 eAED:0.03 QI:274/1/1/1/0.83/0.71/7/2545/865
MNRHQRAGLLLATYAISTSCAFLSPVSHQSLQLRTGGDINFSMSSQQQKQHRGDVSLGLLGDLFKKLKKQGNDEGASESDPNSASEQPSDNVGNTAEAGIQNNAFTNEVNLVNEEESALSQAQKLRAQAARIRLEAEKSQVELTLEKISKLNSKLEHMKSQETVDTKEQRELEDALLALKNQLVTNENGEIKFAQPVVAASTSSATNIHGMETFSSPKSSSSLSEIKADSAVKKNNLSAEELQEIAQKYDEAPEFLRILIAKVAGFGFDETTSGAIDRLNSTDIIQQLYKDESQLKDLSSDSFIKTETENAREMLERAYEKSTSLEDMEAPAPTKEQIAAKMQDLQQVPIFFKDFVSGGKNDTQIAIDLLKEEWRREQDKRGGKQSGFFSLFGEDTKREDKGEIGRDGERMDLENGGTFSRMFRDDESMDEASYRQSDVSLLMESTFPSSTRKEGEAPSERQVNAFVNDVLAPTRSFVPSGNPIPVSGGWIIRGKNECRTGDELIEKLDKRIVTDARLREKISFFVIKDPFPNPEEQMLDPLNWPQVIFVAGPNIARDPRPLIGTIISAVGISTTWYASIYPFLTNTKLFDRAEEAMTLADAGMRVDLSWLSDKSIPLFLAFMALQTTHELAHLAVAKSKNFEVTVPTLVPSVISGITGSITSLKTSPKNKSDLLTFSVAGPLTGMICSLILEVYGLVLTASADFESLQNFPGLPLALLRQSSLGGGVIDLVLGNGILNIPDSAQGAQMLASTVIPLHPFAIAGFVSLLVNALALVPVGRTDGGRIAMSLFGRSGSQAITLASLTVLFVLGLSGSDLMLFYFGFVVLGQSELEIPMRNEVDDVDFPGVTLASLAGFLMILSLVPM